ncbi:unnamed protein product [Rhizophagus irregularis]|nr:unnamed protein product [Rhizophagus irregularis]
MIDNNNNKRNKRISNSNNNDDENIDNNDDFPSKYRNNNRNKNKKTRKSPSYENIIDPFSITSYNTSEEILFSPDQTNNSQQIQITPFTPNLWRPNQSFQHLYPIEESNEISVLTYATIRCGILKIPTCFSCPRPRNRLQFPILAKIPEEIEALPLHHEQIFAPGQAYTVLSRCPNWDNIQIAALDKAAFKTDLDVIKEYEHLEILAQNPLPI